MTRLTIKKTLLQSDYTSYSDAGHARKLAMHKDGKAFLKQLADVLGLEKKDYDLRSNMAGIAVSGEVTLHSDHLYLQLHESCVGGGGLELLYRACDGRRDFCGKRNHFIRMRELQGEEYVQSRFIQDLMSLIPKKTGNSPECAM